MTARRIEQEINEHNFHHQTQTIWTTASSKLKTTPLTVRTLSWPVLFLDSNGRASSSPVILCVYFCFFYKLQILIDKWGNVLVWQLCGNIYHNSNSLFFPILASWRFSSLVFFFSCHALTNPRSKKTLTIPAQVCSQDYYQMSSTTFSFF